MHVCIYVYERNILYMYVYIYIYIYIYRGRERERVREHHYEELAHLNTEAKSHNCCLKAGNPGNLVI